MNSSQMFMAGLDEDALFARAAEIQEGLDKRALDAAVLHGGQHVTDLMESDTRRQLQDNTARAALQLALLEQAPEPPQPKGPSRRSKTQPGAKKRQRQARKANRGR